MFASFSLTDVHAVRYDSELPNLSS